MDSPRVHKLCWDAFSGNVRGLGPASAEMEFVEREAEPFPLFMADKTEPGAYNLPLYLAFCDPMFAPGLILSPKFKKEFRFTIMDVHHTEGDRVVSQFPATGETLSPFRLAHYVSGFSRGSHHGPLMPVKINSPISFFDGPPIVSCIAFSMKDGKFAEPADAFDHPFWDQIRVIASRKAIEIRDQRFFGPAMVGYEELEYGGIVDTLKELDARFKVRQEARAKS